MDLISDIPTPDEAKNLADPLYPKDDVMDEFVSVWGHLASLIRLNAIEKGFSEENEQRNPAELIALIHSEISEALEGLRGNTLDDKLPQFASVEVELADAVIRIMDMADELGLPVAEALIEKMRFNRTRPYKHGKAF